MAVAEGEGEQRELRAVASERGFQMVYHSTYSYSGCK